MSAAGGQSGIRWTTALGALLRGLLAGRIRRLSNRAFWQRHSSGIQVSQLRTLLATAKDTEFGLAHDFTRLSTLPNDELLPAYRKTVPIADWYTYRPLIARMRERGEPNILWPGLVRDFAQTSGTTGGDKYIPVSREMLRSNYLASIDIFASLARFGVSLSWLTTGRVLFLGGSTNLTPNAHGVRTGDLSGIVTPLIRWPTSAVYLPGRDIALMDHWPSKIDAMARRCMNEDVRMVCGMCSWALVLFERMMELARGEGRPVRVITDIWPNFRVFVHGGVKYAPFDPRMRAAYWGRSDGPDLPVRLELYPASEAFVAIQDTPGDPGLRLLTDIGNFFEFVPLEEIDRPDARAMACWEVEKGQRYVVVPSTCAGLWRYVLGDVVEFDSVPDRPRWLGGGGGDGPARLRIVGRHRQFINAFGENLIVEHIENAVARAASECGMIVGEFTAAPVYPTETTRAGLELAVEVENAAPEAIVRFGRAFDAALKAQNVDYTTKRTEGVGMGEPTITPLPPGTFHRWMESRGKLGGQHKCPRCANDRKILDEVVASASVASRV